MSNNSQLQNNKGGVKTQEGKEVSKYNAQKHLILRETPTDYEMEDVSDVFDSLAEDLKPKGKMQEILLEIIASNTIKLVRIAKAESEEIKYSLRSTKWEVLGSSYKPDITLNTVEKLNLYSRYQTATENRIYRAITVLKQLKNE